MKFFDNMISGFAYHKRLGTLLVMYMKGRPFPHNGLSFFKNNRVIDFEPSLVVRSFEGTSALRLTRIGVKPRVIFTLAFFALGVVSTLADFWQPLIFILASRRHHQQIFG